MTSTRVADETAIVLHTRPYRESSLLVTALTLKHGLVHLLAKGVRGGRRGRALQPFTVARIGWTGRSSLVTLTGYEVLKAHWFRGDALACAFYLAEIIIRLLGEREAHPRLHAGLSWALDNLEEHPSLTLRSFEKLLLEELGYGLDFAMDADGRAIREEGCYQLVPDRGFMAADTGIPGSMLSRIAREDFADGSVRRAARVLFREALAQHLGPKPLLSRRMLGS